MADSPIDIERVVREVLAEMGYGDAPPAHDAPKAAPSASAEQPAPAAEGGQLCVSSRMVTMAELADRLGGVRRVVVAADAMVTPLVRDELQRRSVALVYEQPRPAPRAPEAARLVLVVHGRSFDPAGLVRSLQADGIAADPRRTDCVMAACDLLAAELAGGKAVGAVLTRHAAAALCLANRLAGLRAVLGTGAAETAEAAESVGANVLVVSPRSVSPYQLRRVLGDFCRAGVRRCPEVFGQRLA